MSSQRGNVSRTRPQKYQNRTVFNNSMHDTSKRTKKINSLEISLVCKQCKDVLDWKIKYKKYKPLTQPKTCVNCNLKAIKLAYHTLCEECGKTLRVCCKCRQPYIEESSSFKTKEEVLAEMEGELKLLPERKRRTFLRYLDNLYKPKKKVNEPKNDVEKKNEQLDDKKEFKNNDPNNDPNPDYFELVRRRLELLGREVEENDQDFNDDYEDANYDTDSSD